MGACCSTGNSVTKISTTRSDKGMISNTIYLQWCNLIHSQDIDLIRKFLRRQHPKLAPELVNLRVDEQTGICAIHYAIIHKKQQLLHLLMNTSGIDVNIQCEAQMNTALHYAVKNADLRQVKQLFSDPFIKDNILNVNNERAIDLMQTDREWIRAYIKIKQKKKLKSVKGLEIIDDSSANKKNIDFYANNNILPENDFDSDSDSENNSDSAASFSFSISSMKHDDITIMLTETSNNFSMFLAAEVEEKILDGDSLLLKEKEAEISDRSSNAGAVTNLGINIGMDSDEIGLFFDLLKEKRLQVWKKFLDIQTKKNAKLEKKSKEKQKQKKQRYTYKSDVESDSEPEVEELPVTDEFVITHKLEMYTLLYCVTLLALKEKGQKTYGAGNEEFKPPKAVDIKYLNKKMCEKVPRDSNGKLYFTKERFLKQFHKYLYEIHDEIVIEEEDEEDEEEDDIEQQFRNMHY